MNSIITQQVTIMKKQISLVFILGLFAASVAHGKTAVGYLCADWGPAMILPGKTNAVARFNEDEDEIYFLKQVYANSGTSIFLCKMKADGSAKTEIKELWHNVAYPIDTQDQASWLDVNRKTKRIALAIGFAGSDLVGLWVMNMEGTGVKRIITERTEEHQLRAINTCSWTPDGLWIVFEEELRGTKPENRFSIVRCDENGHHFERILSGRASEQYRQPCVSPNGQVIAFVKHPNGNLGDRWIWLMDSDGKHVRPLGGKQSLSTWGTYPAWSPDGKKVFAVSAGVIDAITGITILRKSPRSITLDGKVIKENSNVVMVHWGKLGLLCSGWGDGITLVDEHFHIQHILAATETK